MKLKKSHSHNEPNPHHYCIILAGGVGSRFWPLSKESRPKQFIDVLGIGKSFIRITFERLSPLFRTTNFYVMTGEDYKKEVLEQLPELKPEQILTEPERRNTAPCIAYAAYKLKAKDPDAVMMVTPSDHYVADEKGFRLCVARQLDYAERSDHLLTIGIQPVFPAIGYGYIEVAEDMQLDVPIPVVRFKEKPNLKEAMHMLSLGFHLWNSGMFIWRADTATKALEKYLPEVADLFRAVEGYNTPAEEKEVAKAFLDSPAISIDYGLMEKADNVLVAPGSFGWSDLGTWESLYHQLDKDYNKNAVSSPSENVEVIDSSHLLIKSVCKDKKIVVEGLDNMLIVDTPDNLLICRRGDEKAMHNLIKSILKEEE